MEGKKRKEKTSISARIDKTVADELNDFCKKNGMVKSVVVSKAISDYMLKIKDNQNRLFL